MIGSVSNFTAQTDERPEGFFVCAGLGVIQEDGRSRSATTHKMCSVAKNCSEARFVVIEAEFPSINSSHGYCLGPKEVSIDTPVTQRD